MQDKTINDLVLYLSFIVTFSLSLKTIYRFLVGLAV
jgi:hypothetical protein